jgi:hypothetical protein
MKVYHDFVKGVELPLEQLRFDPDPLALNQLDPPRRVARPRVQQAIGELAVAGLAPKLSPETPAPAAVTDYDVGYLERQQERCGRPRATSDGQAFGPPRWLARFVRGCAVVRAIVHRLFVRICLRRRAEGGRS